MVFSLKAKSNNLFIYYFITLILVVPVVDRKRYGIQRACALAGFGGGGLCAGMFNKLSLNANATYRDCPTGIFRPSFI